MLKTLELDQLFGEIELSIMKEEIQIMTKLTEFITHNWIGDLYEILKLIAELDWYVLIPMLNFLILQTFKKTLLHQHFLVGAHFNIVKLH